MADVLTEFTIYYLYGDAMGIVRVLVVYVLFVSLLFADITDCVLPAYIPVLANTGNLGRSDLIESYYRLGFSYKEILLFLAVSHGIHLSLRHLKRLLRGLGLTKRKKQSDLRDVVSLL